MATIRTKKRLGDLLIDANIITPEQLSEALGKQKNMGGKLGQVLVQLGMTDEEEVMQAMHTQLNLPIARIREAKIPDEVVKLIPENVVRKYNCFPYEVDENNPNILHVAMEDPLNIIALDDIGIVTNMQIEPMVATPSDVRYGIEKHYGNDQVAKMADAYADERRAKRKELSAKDDEANSEVENAPIVILVNKIVEQAVNERASDSRWKTRFV